MGHYRYIMNGHNSTLSCVVRYHVHCATWAHGATEFGQDIYHITAMPDGDIWLCMVVIKYLYKLS